MPLVSAGGGLSTQEFEDFFRFAAACVRWRDAEDSRLISFVFCGGARMQTQLTTAAVGPVGNCIRAQVRLCSTSRQACTAGSDLVWAVTNLQQASLAGGRRNGSPWCRLATIIDWQGPRLATQTACRSV